MSDQPSTVKMAVTSVNILKTGVRSVLVVKLTIEDGLETVHILIPAALERAMEPGVERALVGETAEGALAALKALAEQEGFDASDVRMPVEPRMEIR
ncbi:MAG: hypothetical protein A3E78_13340 [Alphaproteobacteria bacterium RIFCSPHIGHO2_12_FULL_63_12]|nr:MAG: hypothetical protein A3E78_13340 [Alphaproteobacteria bacterium RIFCSPHIGHO2_12_FULL_63_12]